MNVMYHALGFNIVSRAISHVITCNFTCYHVLFFMLSLDNSHGITCMSHDESLVIVVINVESSSSCCNIVTSYSTLKFYILLLKLLFLDLIVYVFIIKLFVVNICIGSASHNENIVQCT